jgi:hypothetical protein
VDIYFVNESTKFSDQEAWQAAWACDYQARYHFGRSGWRSDIRCSFLPGGAKAKIPVGGAIMHLLDTADVARERLVITTKTAMRFHTGACL